MANWMMNYLVHVNSAYLLETGIYLSDTRGMSANNIDGANTSTHSVDCPVQTQYPTESTESG